MLKRNPLSFAIGALAMMSSQALMAQAEIESEMIAAAAEEQVAVEVEEVVVTGSRIQRYRYLTSNITCSGWFSTGNISIFNCVCSKWRIGCANIVS
jgi:hypothetical protein